MEDNDKSLIGVTNFLKTNYGQRIRSKVFNDLRNSSEIKELLRKETEPYNRLMTYYNCALMQVETKFKVLNEGFSLEHDRNPIESIKTRLKTPESIMKKMARKNIAFSTEAIEKNINDIAGIRIICSFPEDIYTLAECLLKQDDVTLIKMKDYIQSPKDNGYRSLHLIIAIPIFLQNEKRMMKVEVQLRTIAMDFWASLEHKLKYKKDLENDKNIEYIAKELRECASISSSLDYRMDDIRKKLGY